jgi:hypothetical protein
MSLLPRPLHAPRGRQLIALGLDLHVLNASTEGDFDGVFTSLIQLRAGGLVIGSDAFFTSRSEQLAALAVRHAVPTVYANREFVAAGGLASYSGSIANAYRLVGVYAARILKGEKPSELPVQQSTKVEMFLNLKTAAALGITVPLSLLGRADEVINSDARYTGHVCHRAARSARAERAHAVGRREGPGIHRGRPSFLRDDARPGHPARAPNLSLRPDFCPRGPHRRRDTL